MPSAQPAPGRVSIWRPVVEYEYVVDGTRYEAIGWLSWFFLATGVVFAAVGLGLVMPKLIGRGAS